MAGREGGVVDGVVDGVGDGVSLPRLRCSSDTVSGRCLAARELGSTGALTTRTIGPPVMPSGQSSCEVVQKTLTASGLTHQINRVAFFRDQQISEE